MTRWFMGTGPDGAVLRATKNSADDPKTTPTTAWQKLAFDSLRAHKISYVYDVREINYSLAKWPQPGSAGTAHYYEPPGTGEADALERIWTYRASGTSVMQASQWHVIFPEKLGFGYTPLIEGRVLTVADNRFVGAQNYYYATDSLEGGETGYVQGSVSYTCHYRDTVSLFHSYAETLYRRTYSLYGYYGLNQDNLYWRYGSAGSTYRDLFAILELPAGNEPIPAYNGVPVPGQKVLRISPTVVRMAYAGHDVGETSHNAFVFNEGRTPAKIIGSGQVRINSGGNAKVLTRKPPTVKTYMDFIAKRTSEALFHQPPYLPSGTSKTNRIGMQYVVEADGIRIYNTGDQNFDVRYMVLDDDDTPGGPKRFYAGNDGSQDYISLDGPNGNILDTRFPYVPIVDEGWLAAGAFNEGSDNPALGVAKKTIWFANDGFLPFVKYTATWSDGSIRAPVNRILRSFNLDQAPYYNNVLAGCTTNCRVSDTALEFYHSSGQPWRTEVKKGAFGTYAEAFGGPALVGIRWYLFAIPVNL